MSFNLYVSLEVADWCIDIIIIIFLTFIVIIIIIIIFFYCPWYSIPKGGEIKQIV